MKATRCSVVVAGILCTAHLSSAATGPVVFGPDNVYDAYTLNLDPGTVTTGAWTINWGDGTTSSTVPASQTTAAHTYGYTGPFDITATLKDSAGKMVDSQYSYRELVRKIDPLAHYNFEDTSGSQHIGPSITKVGTVSTVSSFAGSTGNAVRLAGGSYLSMPSLEMKDADFLGLEFWLKPTNLTTRQMIYAGVGTANGNVRIYVENNNLCFDLIGSGVVKSVPLGYGVETGRWYHFAVSYERSPYFKERNSLRFYRDGFLLKQDTYTATQALAVNHTGATIGAHNTGSVASPVVSNPLSADIDEVVLHRLGVFPGAFLERYRAATSNRSVFRITAGAAGATSFTVNQPVITQEVTVGLDSNPATDNAPRIRSAIGAAAAGTRIKFVNQNNGLGGGTYYLNSIESGGLLRLINKVDIELDGNDANFIVSTWKSKYVQVSGSTRVAVKNMSFDIDQTKWRVGAYALVQSVDSANRKVVIRWVKGAAKVPDVVPSALQNGGLWRWRQVNGTTRQNVRGIEFDQISTSIDPTDGSLWTITFGATGGWTADVISRVFSEVQTAGDLLQVNNVNFSSNGVSLTKSQHVTFDGLKLYAVTGMAFDALNDWSYVKVINSKLGLPPGQTAEDRPFSSGSDGFHFHAAGPVGNVWFENNDIGMTDDDPISLKGGSLYGKTYKRGDYQIEIGSNTGVSSTYIELRKPNLERLNPPFTAYITDYNSATDITTLDRVVPGTVGDEFVLIQLSKRTSNYVFRGNNIHDLNGRMMIYNPDGTFANNRFGNLLFHIGFTRDTYEACGPAANIVLQNNFFNSRSKSDVQAWGQNPLAAIEDINFTNNSFMGTWWTLGNALSPNMTNNYAEAVNQTTETGRGIFYFYQSTFGTAFGNIHYNPTTTTFATKNSNSDFTEGANELIPNRTVAADVIVDNTNAVFTGTWGTSSANVGQFYGTNYRWSNTASSTATFTPTLPVAGTYRVYAMWNGGTDRGITVPYTITHSSGTITVPASQRTGGGLWVYLGSYTFNAGAAGSVKVSTTGANGLIIADAVRFQQ